MKATRMHSQWPRVQQCDDAFAPLVVTLLLVSRVLQCAVRYLDAFAAVHIKQRISNKLLDIKRLREQIFEQVMYEFCLSDD